MVKLNKKKIRPTRKQTTKIKLKDIHSSKTCEQRLYLSSSKSDKDLNPQSPTKHQEWFYFKAINLGEGNCLMD